jgi:excisionase family DNA binding protein
MALMENTQRVLLTVAEAAERLGVARSYLYLYVRDGSIPSVKLGRARRIPVKALDQFIERLLADQGQAG